MFGALRAAAQTVYHEIAMGFAFVGVLLAAGSYNLQQIVLHQQERYLALVLVAIITFIVVYWISGVAETNRILLTLQKGNLKSLLDFMWNIQANNLPFLFS